MNDGEEIKILFKTTHNTMSYYVNWDDVKYEELQRGCIHEIDMNEL